MKWSVVGLVIAGLVASLCAALLVASLRANSSSEETTGSADVTVIMAAQDLPAMSVIKSGQVVQKTLPRAQAPEGALSDPVQVVGNILTSPIVKDQAFTKSNFAAEGTGMHLASALPDGMRAVGIELSNYGGLKGILYPGSIVDVLVTFHPPAQAGEKAGLISMTLLQGVNVLAVADRTVTSDQKASAVTSSLTNRKLLVTLMLDGSQAEKIQLATEHGVISLALRNPLDRSSIRRPPTALSELSKDWGMLASVQKPAIIPVIAQDAEQDKSRPVYWETIIIRGRATEKLLLPPPEERISDGTTPL